jgi:hypothetical protein
MKANNSFPHVHQERKPRNCLKCNEEFLSTDAANRICDTCNEVNRSSSKRVEKSGPPRSTHATNKGGEVQ